MKHGYTQNTEDFVLLQLKAFVWSMQTSSRDMVKKFIDPPSVACLRRKFHGIIGLSFCGIKM